MIKRLRLKIISLCIAILTITLAVIVSAMNLINYNTLVHESDRELLRISEKSLPPSFEEIRPPEVPDNDYVARPPDSFGDKNNRFESRFFSVKLIGGSITEVSLDNIGLIDDATAREYALNALDLGSDKGFYFGYRYLINSSDNETTIFFLDIGRRAADYWSFLWTSVLLTFVGLLLLSIATVLLANRIVKPVEESYEKQKRFITDAGHELKTPIAIINANVDLLRDELESNECVEDIAAQAQRLKRLTEELVYLARMEESEGRTIMSELPFSEVVADIALQFRSVAERDGKSLRISIADGLSIKGDITMLEKLVTIILDNAIKYSPTESDITLELKAIRRCALLCVSNVTEEEFENGDIERVFDRFWRNDKARNKSGYGIGLSLAKAIVEKHSGKIYAENKEDVFKISAEIPLA